MPLENARLGLLLVPSARHDDHSVIASALYFSDVQACLVFEAPVRVDVVMGSDTILHEALLFRARRSTYDILSERANYEKSNYHMGDGPCSREIDGITLTAKGNPRCADRWFTAFEHVREIDERTHVYSTLVSHHVAFDALVALIEKPRLAERPMRLFHTGQQQSVDFPVSWVGTRPPVFIEATGVVPRGSGQRIAFLPHPHTGTAPARLVVFSAGIVGDIVRIIEPKLYAPPDVTCTMHLAALPNPAPTVGAAKKSATATATAVRKRKRDEDDIALLKDRKQQRIELFFKKTGQADQGEEEEGASGKLSPPPLLPAGDTEARTRIIV